MVNGNLVQGKRILLGLIKVSIICYDFNITDCFAIGIVFSFFFHLKATFIGSIHINVFTCLYDK